MAATPEQFDITLSDGAGGNVTETCYNKYAVSQKFVHNYVAGDNSNLMFPMQISAVDSNPGRIIISTDSSGGQSYPTFTMDMNGYGIDMLSESAGGSSSMDLNITPSDVNLWRYPDMTPAQLSDSSVMTKKDVMTMSGAIAGLRVPDSGFTSSAVTRDLAQSIGGFGSFKVGKLFIIQHNQASSDGGFKSGFVKWNGAGTSAGASWTQLESSGASFTVALASATAIITLTPTTSAYFQLYLMAG